MNLLRLYYDSLSQMIKSLGSDPDKLFTFDNLLGEIKRYGNYGFIITPLVLPVSLADSSRIANLDEVCNEVIDSERSKELITGLSDGAQIEYEKRINEVFGDLVDLGYFSELK